jgi:hypothetical protein
MIIYECWNCGQKLEEDDDKEEVTESSEMNFCHAKCAEDWLFDDEDEEEYYGR